MNGSNLNLGISMPLNNVNVMTDSLHNYLTAQGSLMNFKLGKSVFVALCALLPQLASANEISFTSWSVGICHSFASESPAVLGPRSLSQIDFLSGAEVASSSSQFEGLQIRSYNGVKIENRGQLIKEVNIVYYTSLERPVFEGVIDGSALSDTLPVCVMANLEDGTELAVGWDDGLARNVLNRFAALHFKSDEVKPPSLSNGVVNVYGKNSEIRLKLYVSGPGQLATVFYFPTAAINDIEAHARSNSINFSLLESDRDDPEEMRLVASYEWQRGKPANFLKFINFSRDVERSVLKARISFLDRRIENGLKNIGARLEVCRQKTTSKQARLECFRNSVGK